MAVNELSAYLTDGNVKNSVNLPNLSMEKQGKVRITVIMQGDATTEAKTALEAAGIHVKASTSAAKKGVGYALFDTDDEVTDALPEQIRSDHILAIRII